jgi:hypothetical protein
VNAYGACRFLQSKKHASHASALPSFFGHLMHPLYVEQKLTLLPQVLHSGCPKKQAASPPLISRKRTLHPQ